MNKLILAVAFVSISKASALAQGAPTPLPPEPPEITAAKAAGTFVIEHPTWVRLASPVEFNRAYPQAALRLEVSGKVGLRCRIAAAGKLANCVTTSEAPLKLGFADGAKTLAESAMQTTPTVTVTNPDGGQPLVISTEGAVVDISVSFALPP